MGLFLQVGQTGSPRKDVGLAVQTLPEGVAAPGEHVVEHTARGEHVHCAGLRPGEEREEEAAASRRSAWLSSPVRGWVGAEPKAAS